MGGVRSRSRALTWLALLPCAAVVLGCGRTSKSVDDTDPEPGAGGIHGVDTTEPPADEPNCAISISGQNGRHCAAYQDGSVWCWGTDGGSAGPSNFAPTAKPQRVAGLQNAQRVVVGPRHSCALDNDGRLICWGDNESGQIDDSNAPALPPTVIDLNSGGSPIDGFGLGETQTCALNFLLHAYCRGADFRGRQSGPRQLDVPGEPGTTLPGNGPFFFDAQGFVLEPVDWTHVSFLPNVGGDNAWFSGYGSSCVIKRTGSLWCTEKQPDAEASELVARAVLGERVVQAGTGRGFVCALNGEGQVWCQGANEHGQLGSEQGSPPAAGAFIESLAGVRAISVNDYSACALGSDGAVWCWGSYAQGKLSNTPEKVSSCAKQTLVPIDVPRLTGLRPNAPVHLAEASRARAQAMCICAYGTAETSCVAEEDRSPNVACVAALTTNDLGRVECRAAALWQDAECFANQACPGNAVVSGCPALECPPFKTVDVEQYCRRVTCAGDLERVLTKAQICNGVSDCDDGSDERNCRDDLNGSFECNPETRIPLLKVCDAVPDCDDGSDEQYCN